MAVFLLCRRWGANWQILSADRLKRYAGMARLFYKYGNRDLVSRAGLDEALGAARADRPSGDESEAEAGAPQEASTPAKQLAADLEQLGPTFIKLGQLLSTRADLLPPAYLEALARLQDNVEPFPFADVERIVQDELGVRLSKAFASVRPKRRSRQRRSARCIAPCCATAVRWRSRCSDRTCATGS